MAKFLLDTNILLHYVRGSTLALLVDNEFSPSVLPNYSVVSVVSLGEIYSLAICRKWGDQKKDILMKLLKSIPSVDINNPLILSRFSEIDAFCLGKHPEKPLPPGESAKSIGDNDLWIAATASVLKATLLTTDKDFLVFKGAFLDVVYLDPEKYKEKS
jgi:tRNA(fMet)-specific endonuclease VapC